MDFSEFELLKAGDRVEINLTHYMLGGMEAHQPTDILITVEVTRLILFGVKGGFLKLRLIKEVDHEQVLARVLARSTNRTTATDWRRWISSTLVLGLDNLMVCPGDVIRKLGKHAELISSRKHNRKHHKVETKVYKLKAPDAK